MSLICELVWEDISLFNADGSSVSPSQEPLWSDLQDCCASGNVEEAIRYLMDTYEIDWRAVVKVEGSNPVKFDNIPVTDELLKKTAQAIYFDNPDQFTDPDQCKMHLLWQATSDIIETYDSESVN